VVLEISRGVNDAEKAPECSKTWPAVPGEVPRGGCTWTESSGQGRLGTRSLASSAATKQMGKEFRESRNRDEEHG
jgi:hypothetical protein